MKKIIYLISILAAATFSGIFFQQKFGANNRQALGRATYSTNNNLRKATLSIEGMWCSSCAVGAQYSLKNLEGVKDAYIGFNKDLKGKGWVVYNPAKVPKEQIIKAIEPYKAKIVSDVIYN